MSLNANKAGGMRTNRIVEGVIRALRLDATFYEELEHDPSYDQDALVVVILASLVGSVGSFLSLLFNGRIVLAFSTLVIGALLAIAGYYLWVYVTYFVSTKFFKGSGDVAGLRRALGFAYAPQFLRIVTVVPCVGAVAGVVAWIWSIVTAWTATRQAMNMDQSNALIATIISGVVTAIIIAIITGIFFALGLVGASATGALG